MNWKNYLKHAAVTGVSAWFVIAINHGFPINYAAIGKAPTVLSVSGTFPNSATAYNAARTARSFASPNTEVWPCKVWDGGGWCQNIDTGEVKDIPAGQMYQQLTD